MRTKFFLSALLLLAGYFSRSQDISGTWYGFQVSRDKGEHKEYRITIEIKMSDEDDFTGTMQLKSIQKGTITSTFTGKIDKADNVIYLRENKIVTEGIQSKDASLCNYVLKLKRNSLKGTGRSMQKGYDHLTLHLERRDRY